MGLCLVLELNLWCVVFVKTSSGASRPKYRCETTLCPTDSLANDKLKVAIAEQIRAELVKAPMLTKLKLTNN